MKPLDFEKNIGIEAFLTKYRGIGGKLRTIAQDFIVNEIFLYPKKNETGNYTIAEVNSENWETHKLVRELSKRLKISQKRIGFAGTKDKRACSSQLMSFYNVSVDGLSNVNIKDVKLDNFYTSDEFIRIGSLIGNSFEINIRNIKKNISCDTVDLIVNDINNYGGFPNFYGIQRFGVVRPVTHIIGKHIVNGDFQSAVMDYIANPIKGENEETYNLREELSKTFDFKKALQSYPNVLNFEKIMLNKLVQDPSDFISALKELPKNLSLMFINAYQSYIFNRIISIRLNKKISLNTAIIGDIIQPVKNGFIDDQNILVKESNIEKVNKQIRKNKAVITAVLIGSDSVFSKGEMGEIEHLVVEQEKINKLDFIIPQIPFLSSKGSRRPILAFVKNISYNFFNDDLEKDKKALKIKFELQKGCYATSFLREIMKSENPKNY